MDDTNGHPAVKDEQESHFWKFFRNNFTHLGLKKLVVTHYRPSMLFENSEAYMLMYDGKKTKKTSIEGEGCFKSPICKKLMKEADIVCTNPPFSQLRDYIAQLVEYKKKFLIVGNMNAVAYKEIFPLISENRMWLGVTPEKGGMEFRVPDDYQGRISDTRNGERFVKMGFGVWFTNLPNKRRKEKFIATGKYTPEEYPTYDNYDAIEVSKVANIPENYKGEMGVPASYLTKHNPQQFEIVGTDDSVLRQQNKTEGRFYVAGKRKYARIVIKWKEQFK